MGRIPSIAAPGGPGALQGQGPVPPQSSTGSRQAGFQGLSGPLWPAWSVRRGLLRRPAAGGGSPTWRARHRLRPRSIARAGRSPPPRRRGSKTQHPSLAIAPDLLDQRRPAATSRFDESLVRQMRSWRHSGFAARRPFMTKPLRGRRIPSEIHYVNDQEYVDEPGPLNRSGPPTDGHVAQAKRAAPGRAGGRGPGHI